MLTAIIIVMSCVVITIGLQIFFAIKLIIHYKEIDVRNKYFFRLVTAIILTLIFGGVNTFLIIKYSIDKLTN
jgi:hypothetical protein